MFFSLIALNIATLSLAFASLSSKSEIHIASSINHTPLAPRHTLDPLWQRGMFGGLVQNQNRSAMHHKDLWELFLQAHGRARQNGRLDHRHFTLAYKPERTLDNRVVKTFYCRWRRHRNKHNIAVLYL